MHFEEEKKGSENVHFIKHIWKEKCLIILCTTNAHTTEKKRSRKNESKKIKDFLNVSHKNLKTYMYTYIHEKGSRDGKMHKNT